MSWPWVRVVGVWGTLHLDMRWGRSDGVGLCWECSLLERLHWGKGPDTQPPVSIHHFSLCEPTAQISQAGKQEDLMNSCFPHQVCRNMNFGEKKKRKKETFLWNNPLSHERTLRIAVLNVVFAEIQFLRITSMLNLCISWRLFIGKKVLRNCCISSTIWTKVSVE